MWEALNRNDPSSLYDAARYRAVTAAVFKASGESEASTKNQPPKPIKP